jgi:glutathione S-transferase
MTRFTIVDAHVASWTAFLAMMKHDLQKHARGEAWNARCTARPAFKTVMQP